VSEEVERTVTSRRGESSRRRVEAWWPEYLRDGSGRLSEAKGTELVGLVVERLEAPLREGRMEPGDRLPPERLLAAEMRISRATVREALHELELKGLVKRRQGRGTIVAEVDRAEFTQLLLRRLTIQERGLLEIMDFREVTEVPIAARAARYATDSEITRMEAALARMETEISAERYAELDDRFHQLIAQATHNPLLFKIVQASADWTRSARNPILEDSRRRRTSLEGHRHILACIRERDPDGAGLAMKEHLRAVLDQMIAMLEADPTSTLE
jgi:GntR family transcriptional regulator, transcriptional repressor for pyruvate dehydrogenase complex